MKKTIVATLVFIVLSSLAVPVTGAVPVGGISGGGSHSLQVVSDGTLRSWGNNNIGQLGDGTTLPHSIPESVPGMTSVLSAVACGNFSLALKSDGTVWSWGGNGNGNLGDGTTTARFSPIQVTTLSGIIGIACGNAHSLALKNDGTVWAWGANANGQLGDGTIVNKSAPAQVPGLTSVVSISAGDTHSLAVKNDGSAWAWGANGGGQLGNGNTSQQPAPVQVTVITNVLKVAGGSNHSLALKTDGTVWAWGNNAAGQLGDGTQNQHTSPVQVTGLTGILGIDAGGSFSLALKNDGTVRAWGFDTDGELGDGASNGNAPLIRNSPVQVAGLTNAVAVAAGNNFGLALLAGDAVVGWGFDGFGSLGDGAFSVEPLPQQVPGVASGITSISAGANHSLARKNDGTVEAWGQDNFGQLGNNGLSFSNFGVLQVPGLTLVQDVAAGGNHSLAVKTDGTVWAWGGNANGQVGDGTQLNRGIPVQVTALSGITAIAAGNNFSLALKNDQTVWAWGNNGSGQLGDGTQTQHLTPFQISGLTGVVAIAAGGNFSAAVKSDGTVWTWGGLFLVPTQFPGLTGFISVSASSGSGHALLLNSDGTVWGFGNNNTGQLGDGTTNSFPTTPVQTLGMANAVSVAAGTNHSLAVTADGVVWAWGLNSSFQLGNLSNLESDRPVRVAFLTGQTATKVSAANHSMVLMSDGSVVSWGLNNSTQTGYGNYLARTTSVNAVAFGSPDLKIAKSHSGALIVGQQAVYTITVTNIGGGAVAGPIVVDDLLPTGVAYVSAGGAGWTCILANGFIQCSNPASMVASASSVITVTAKIKAAAFPGISNVTGLDNDSIDINPLNNSAGDSSVVAPLPRSVTPGAGSGTTQTFTFAFDAANGWQSIGLVDVLINDSLDGISACYIAFVPSGQGTGNLYLVNDAGDAGGPYSSMAIPSANTVSNSQCSIAASGSSVSGTSNTLTLSLAITFSGPFIGNRIFYMAAQDNALVNSGWHALGTWIVPTTPPVGPDVKPSVPARSSAASQILTFTFTDTAGFADIAVTNVLINDFLDGIGACYLAFAPASANTGYLYLVDDAGDGGYVSGSPMFLPSGGTLQNSQCSIAATGSSISSSGNNLTVTLNITFQPAFSGDRVIYGATRTGSLNTGWKAIGSVSVP